MRSAKVTATGFEVSCPRCREGIVEPKSGSFLWTTEDVAQAGGEIQCHECNLYLTLALPARAATNLAGAR